MEEILSMTERILTSFPGSQVALRTSKTQASGASHRATSNLILDSWWFPESNKCQEFYEGRQEAERGGKDRGLGLKGAQLVNQIVKGKGQVLSFLESQLEKMAILKPLSLKRLREETSGCPKGILQQARCFCSSYDSTVLNQSHISGTTKKSQCLLRQG